MLTLPFTISTYMTVHVKMHKSAKNLVVDFYEFCIYLQYVAVHNIAENLVQLAGCVAKIRLLLCQVDGEHISSKRTNLYA